MNFKKPMEIHKHSKNRKQYQSINMHRNDSSNKIKNPASEEINPKKITNYRLDNNDYTLLQQYVNLDITALQSTEPCQRNRLRNSSNENKNMKKFKNETNSINLSPESTMSMNECLNQLAQSQFTSNSIDMNEFKMPQKNMEKKRKLSLTLKQKNNTVKNLEYENISPLKIKNSNAKGEFNATVPNREKSIMKNAINDKIIPNIAHHEVTNGLIEENIFMDQRDNVDKSVQNPLNRNEKNSSKIKDIESNHFFINHSIQFLENDTVNDEFCFSDFSQVVKKHPISKTNIDIADKVECDAEIKFNNESELNEINDEFFIDSQLSQYISPISNNLTENKNELNKCNYESELKKNLCSRRNINKLVTSTQISDLEASTKNQICNLNISPISSSITVSKKIENHNTVRNSFNEHSIIESQNNWTQSYELDLLEQHNELFLQDLSQKFGTTKFREEVEVSFIKCKNAIHKIAPGQDESLKKINLNDNNLSNEVNIPQNINEHTCKDDNSYDAVISEWSQDTVIKNLEEKEKNSIGLGDKIKTMLLNNAQNFPLNQSTQFSLVMDGNVSFKDLGPFYGLPLKVKDLILQFKGIQELYEWQSECLNLEAVNRHKNLIYALPTSGGKTLVAEILLLREILCRKKNVLFILPYVSIVQEKVWSLSPFAVTLDFLIEEYAASKGSYPPRKRKYKNTVYIATIEKGLGLVNSLLEEGRLGEIGLVIVDEFHLIGESKRGSNLEIVLTKLLFSREDIQIIGMSATIGNLQELSYFLHAEIYTKSFRPVELEEFVKCGNRIALIDWKANACEHLFMPVRKVNYKYPEFISKIDPDHLGGLVMEVIPDASCLIFCPSKQNCENVALLLCKVLFRRLLEHRKKEKNDLLMSLESEGKTCAVLAKTIPFGVAYHHSGLTTDERKVIEDGFRSGVLSVICCTSTLAAGVNLPAKRVILRSPYIARDFITLAKYKQMVGRAGRAGLGETGESIIICAEKDISRLRSLLTAPMDNAISQMNKTDGLMSLILSSIGLKIATTRYNLQNLVKVSLMSVQAELLGIDVNSLVHENIIHLIDLHAVTVKEYCKLIECNKKVETSEHFQKDNIKNELIHNQAVDLHTELEISKLGRAAIKGSMNLNLARMLYEDLVIAQSSLVLLDSLHLLYLVIPYDLAEQIKPTMSIYYKVFTELGKNELRTAQVIGITEPCAVQMMLGQRIMSVPERVLNRFYLTLILYELWNQKSLFVIADKYKVNRGIIQQLMQGASSFASNVVRFCEEFDEFWAFCHLLKDISSRLAYCCTPELLPLMELPAVKKSRAKQLYSAGYRSLQSIAKANPNDLMTIEYVNRSVANQLIAAAKLLLLERVETLKEEAEEVLEGLQN